MGMGRVQWMGMGRGFRRWEWVESSEDGNR